VAEGASKAPLQAFELVLRPGQRLGECLLSFGKA